MLGQHLWWCPALAPLPQASRSRTPLTVLAGTRRLGFWLFGCLLSSACRDERSFESPRGQVALCFYHSPAGGMLNLRFV
eukprot:8345446-Ditylum_brightwellii.AAC.2